MEYNTTRERMLIPEYGRNVQKLIQYALTIEDREKRTKAARMIVAMMGQLYNPSRETGDIRQKLWDHLFIISNYQLDVDSPFTKPEPKPADAKPSKTAYPHKFIRFKQYGKNIEFMIKEATNFEEGEEKQYLVKTIANHLKKMYLNWNRESVDDAVIIEHLRTLSDGKLVLSPDVKLEATIDIIARAKKKKLVTNGKNQSNNNNNSNYHRDKPFIRKKPKTN
ncbi:MAG: DUF4290 domain-containing protein [Bacteroidota bacterium]